MTDKYIIEDISLEEGIGIVDGNGTVWRWGVDKQGIKRLITTTVDGIRSISLCDGMIKANEHGVVTDVQMGRAHDKDCRCFVVNGVTYTGVLCGGELGLPYEERRKQPDALRSDLDDTMAEIVKLKKEVRDLTSLIVDKLIKH